MAKLFNIDDVEIKKSNSPEDKAEILRENFIQLHEFKVETLKKLNGRLPQPGEFFALWTLKSFNAFTFIPYLINQFGIIDSLVISTYSVNRRIVDSLIKKIDQNKINRVHLFISDSLKYRMPKVVDHLESLTRHRSQITITYAWNHSKITLINCQNNHFVIEGSGNWSENAQYEQYLFFNNENLYKFRLKCITNDLE